MQASRQLISIAVCQGCKLHRDTVGKLNAFLNSHNRQMKNAFFVNNWWEYIKTIVAIVVIRISNIITCLVSPFQGFIISSPHLQNLLKLGNSKWHWFLFLFYFLQKLDKKIKRMNWHCYWFVYQLNPETEEILLHFVISDIRLMITGDERLEEIGVIFFLWWLLTSIKLLVATEVKFVMMIDVKKR